MLVSEAGNTAGLGKTVDCLFEFLAYHLWEKQKRSINIEKALGVCYDKSSAGDRGLKDILGQRQLLGHLLSRYFLAIGYHKGQLWA